MNLREEPYLSFPLIHRADMTSIHHRLLRSFITVIATLRAFSNGPINAFLTLLYINQ